MSARRRCRRSGGCAQLRDRAELRHDGGPALPCPALAPALPCPGCWLGHDGSVVLFGLATERPLARTPPVSKQSLAGDWLKLLSYWSMAPSSCSPGLEDAWKDLVASIQEAKTTWEEEEKAEKKAKQKKRDQSKRKNAKENKKKGKTPSSKKKQKNKKRVRTKEQERLKKQRQRERRRKAKEEEKKKQQEEKKKALKLKWKLKYEAEKEVRKKRYQEKRDRDRAEKASAGYRNPLTQWQ